jgi:hypothetical protein
MNTERQWSDYLTLDNIQDFAERLRALLANKRFTFIAVNNGRGDNNNSPDVRIGQQLQGRQRQGERRAPDGDASNICLSEATTLESLSCKGQFVKLLDGSVMKHQIVTVCDSYGVWSVSTVVTDKLIRESYSKRNRDCKGWFVTNLAKDKIQEEKQKMREKATYFSFEPAMRDQPERVTITLTAGAGHIIHWLIYPEN